MDLSKSYKVNAQLNHVETQYPNRFHFSNLRKMSILFVLTLLIGSLIFAPVHLSYKFSESVVLLVKSHRFKSPLVFIFYGLSGSSYNKNNKPSLNTVSQTAQLVTQSPDSDLESLFSLSLNSALSELSRIRTLPDSLSQRVNESQTRTALGDCEGLFEDAYNMVDKTVEVVGGHVAGLDRWSVNEVYTWISGGMSNIDTCLDGLEEMGSEKWVLDEVRREVACSKSWLSNCLAILADIKSFIDKTIGIL